MSETKENQHEEEPSEDRVEDSSAVSGVEEADSNSKEPSLETPKKNTPIMYGTRKLHPGSKSASAKSLKQLRGPQEDDDLLEMDDLVVKSTAPAHLVENDGPNPNRRRNRERNRDNENEDQEPDVSSSDDSDNVPYPVDELESKDRPERFAEVEKRETPRTHGVQEFRPSKDGKRAEPKKRAKANGPTRRPVAKEKSKGLFGWLKSIFTSDEGAEGQSSDGKKRRPNQNRRRNNRGGQGRSRDGQSRSDGSGNRRPRRNRRPRGRQGSPSGQQSDSNRGNRPRRRRRKPQGEGRKSQSSS
ncbi:MAG TPA: hypothetical protein DIV79_13670 [Opitutae bacterium]|nr:hypothetical protein [Opitutaceae bacterium]HCR31056.1 hypothetical protein [Opitutae bacterium]